MFNVISTISSPTSCCQLWLRLWESITITQERVSVTTFRVLQLLAWANRDGMSKYVCICYKLAEQETNFWLGMFQLLLQACTEMIMPQCSDGVLDMFPEEPWDLNLYMSNCEKMYGLKPQPDFIKTMFGGKDISAHSNIIFRHVCMHMGYIYMCNFHVGGLAIQYMCM